MLLLYDSAARIQEMLSIRLRDIRLGATPTVTLHGKARKIRTVPLMRQTAEHCAQYMSLFHADEQQYSEQHLFHTVIHGMKKPLNDSTVRRFLYDYADTVRKHCLDIPNKVHPHLFRHSRAMHLYQHGMDLSLVSQWLGHAQLETSLIYIMLTRSKNARHLKRRPKSKAP